MKTQLGSFTYEFQAAGLMVCPDCGETYAAGPDGDLTPCPYCVQEDNNTGIAIWIQCHTCKEWHELTAEEVGLYINAEHEGQSWTCPECIE